MEEELIHALTSGNYALWIWTPKRKRFEFSANYYEILGYSPFLKPEESNTIIDHVHPDDLPLLMAQIDTYIKSQKQDLKLKFRVLHKDGRMSWMFCFGEPVAWQADGTPSRLAGIIIDTDEQPLVKSKVGYNEALVANLVNTFPGMAYRNEFFEGSWKPVYVSKGSLDLLGYEQEYFLQNKEAIYLDIIVAEDYSRIWRKINQAIIDKKPFHLIYRMKTASGRYNWVWEYGKAIFSKDGKAVAMEGFITDVTRQKELEIQLSKENESLKSSLKERYRFGDIIGKSALMQKVYELIVKAAASRGNVIIYGESGTGKELVARMIHQLSDRKEKPFVTFNCGAIPENLLESELFGYKKGAFTGADRDTKGYLRIADEGTLFLDEIGEISPSFQVKLLRVLEGRGYKPLGSTENYLPNIRIIGATSRNLVELVDQGKMRVDFFYRVYIIPIRLPPLRDKREDVPFLIEYFMEKYNPNGKVDWMVERLYNELQGYDWPGNVRELENTIQRYITLGYIELISSKVPGSTVSKNPDRTITMIDDYGLREVLDMRERDLIITALEKNHWRRDETASMLRITPRTLYRKMKYYRIYQSENQK